MRVCVNVSSHLSRMCLPRSWAGRGRGMNQSCRCRCLHFHMAQTDSHRHLQRRGKMGENNRYVDSRRIAVMLKGKIIRTVVRSAMIYGWETVVNNRQKAEVEEMKMWYIYIYIYKYTFYTLNTIHILVFKGHFALNCCLFLSLMYSIVQYCVERMRWEFNPWLFTFLRSLFPSHKTILQAPFTLSYIRLYACEGLKVNLI